MWTPGNSSLMVGMSALRSGSSALNAGVLAPPTHDICCYSKVFHLRVAPVLYMANYQIMLARASTGQWNDTGRVKYGMGSRKYMARNRWKQARKGLLHKER